MADSRRKRPDSRQLWDESDRRVKAAGGRDRERGQEWDRTAYRSRSRSRDRRGPGNRYDRDRSRSPGRPAKGRGDDRDRDGGRGRGGRRRHDRDVRDWRNDGEARDPRSRNRSRRDSQSPGSPPRRRQDPSSLPTRPRTEKRSQPSMAVHVDRNGDRDAGREDEHHERGRGGRRDEDRMDEDGNSDDDGEEEEVEVDDDMAAMQAMMGFGGFTSTKGKQIAGNDVGAVRKEKKSEYRQYMNRQGGFNRPLSPGR